MKSWPLRVTITTQMVIRALLINPNQPMYGYQIGKATRLPSGTVGPILKRLEDTGWATSDDEDTEPTNRPRRRYYRLTPEGIEQGTEYARAR